MTSTMSRAGLYVLSGCSQPLILTLLKDAGLADPTCQLYMFFYSLGPATIIFPLLLEKAKWPSTRMILKAAGICLFDIVATVMNYTGASLAGPTIFSIVYSSVTIWTACFSQIMLGRVMNARQWMAVAVVFGGLVLTAVDSQQLGEKVTHGLFLILAGSAMHAMTYIMSEGIMTVTKEVISARQNNAIQSGVAAATLLLWQLFYTLPRWNERIWVPMQAAGTTMSYGLGILMLFSLSNLVHSSTFFHTLRYFPGGSTSAGVMKGLQAVLVFVATHFVYCGRTGGEEMCFTQAKLLSLVTVAGGVMGYGLATPREYEGATSTAGYEPVDNVAALEIT
eukprot:CAMPEP_0119011246 /NCGR_PEP_ID=MMETSP1176-20130426/5552_1 /TAXON_ID=265551 /ORGANISM="Synedropsis recta cf, Strain CCMP1620" /LENGTH=335 /DNA_ID=CAMNT_0006964043 /DNA_START=166 /DNA_END=1173 /DNA_ORIENTATION=-